MSLVVLFEGKESVKIIEGQRKKVIPFAGATKDYWADYSGFMSKMGVGLIFPDEQRTLIEGPHVPHNLVDSYRAMQIAEKMPKLDNLLLSSGDLSRCFNLAWCDFSYADAKIEEGVGKDELLQIRDALLPNLDGTIRKLEEHQIELSAWDLVREIKRGKLKQTETITKAIERFSDEVLVFHGLSGEYKTAYECLTTGDGDLSNVVVEAAKSCCRTAAQFVDFGVPYIKQLYEKIKLDYFRVRKPHIIGEKSDTFVKERQAADNGFTNANTAFLKLKKLRENSIQNPYNFVEYHKNLQILGESFRELPHRFAFLSIYDKQNSDVYIRMQKEADKLLTLLNSLLRERMPLVYHLN